MMTVGYGDQHSDPSSKKARTDGGGVYTAYSLVGGCQWRNDFIALSAGRRWKSLHTETRKRGVGERAQ